MNPADEAPDEAFLEFLAAHADALGELLPDGTPVPDDPALRLRLEAAQECLRRLGQIWPRPAVPDDDRPTRREGATQAAPPEEEPVALGRFRIVRRLGRGGCGIVYLAIDPALQRPVALKVPRPELALDTEARHRFVLEARAAAGLDHPHIVPVYETGEI